MTDRRLRDRSPLEAGLLMAGDAFMLEAAFLAAYWIRFYSGVWLVPLGIPPLSLYLGASAVVIAVFLGIFYASGLYSDRGDRRLADDLLKLVKGVVLGSLLVLALAFFLKREAYSRSFFGLFFLTSLAGLIAGRVAMRSLVRRILPLRTRILLVGASPMRDRVLWLSRQFPGLRLEPVGWVDLGGSDRTTRGPAADEQECRDGGGGGSVLVRRRIGGGDAPAIPAAEPVRCLGRLSDVRRLVVEHEVDRVVLTLPFSDLEQVAVITEELANLSVDLQFVPDLFALHLSRMRMTEIGGIPFLSVREDALSGADRVVKRTFDVMASGAGLLLLSPLLVALAAAVKLTSPGPVFYRQARVGRDGREFHMAKFRSMRADAENDSGPVWTVVEDPRVTPVGRFLRRWSLDELPQLWNVLAGDMSLVGPRPERKVFVERFVERMPRYFERHRVKSGLTGWAQVNGLRGNTSIEERTLYDLHYVENWSLGLDIKILLMTVHHVLRGENAY
ncbi:MAG: undecaprenyl-phosphate glucose phosphotransferase [Candidatus Krumholzibacteriia bacterium]